MSSRDVWIFENLPSLRGMFTLQGGCSKCQGLWAINDDAHDIPGVPCEFELQLDAVSAVDGTNQSDFPVSGKYRGWFVLKDKAGIMRIDDEVDITFNKKDNSSGYTIKGKGGNSIGKFLLKGSMSISGYAQMYRKYTVIEIVEVDKKVDKISTIDSVNYQFGEVEVGELVELKYPYNNRIKCGIVAFIEVDRRGDIIYVVKDESNGEVVRDLPRSAFWKARPTLQVSTQSLAQPESNDTLLPVAQPFIPAATPVVIASSSSSNSNVKKEKKEKKVKSEKSEIKENKGKKDKKKVVKVVVGDLVKMKPPHDTLLKVGRVVAIDLLDRKNIYIIQDEKTGELIPEARRLWFEKVSDSKTKDSNSNGTASAGATLDNAQSTEGSPVKAVVKKKAKKPSTGLFVLPPALLSRILSVYLDITNLARLDQALCTSCGLRELYLNVIKRDDFVIRSVNLSCVTNFPPILSWLFNRMVKVYAMHITTSKITAEDAILFKKVRVTQYHVNCGDILDSSVVYLPYNNRILSLSLSGNNRIAAGAYSFIAENMRQMRVLDVSHIPKMSDLIVQRIATNLTKLQRLVISNNNRVTDVGLHYIATHLKGLDYLNIAGYGNTFTDLGIKGICENLLNLRALNISKCSAITDLGLGFIPQLTQLEVFEMSGCWRCTESGLNNLVAKLCIVNKLNLSYCHISDTTLLVIAQNMVEIKQLIVQCCRITDRGVTAVLGQSKRIKLFDVTDCSHVCIVDYPNVHIIR